MHPPNPKVTPEILGKPIKKNPPLLYLKFNLFWLGFFFRQIKKEGPNALPNPQKSQQLEAKKNRGALTPGFHQGRFMGTKNSPRTSRGFPGNQRGPPHSKKSRPTPPNPRGLGVFWGQNRGAWGGDFGLLRTAPSSRGFFEGFPTPPPMVPTCQTNHWGK